MADLKRKRSPNFMNERDTKMSRATSPSGPPSDSTAPTFQLEPESSSLAIAGFPPPVSAVVNPPQLHQSSDKSEVEHPEPIVIREEDETIDSFLARVKATLAEHPPRIHITSSRATLQVPVDEDILKRFEDKISNEAVDSWVEEERNPYDTDDVKEGRVRRDVVGLSKSDLRVRFRKFILREAADLDIVRGKWLFFVAYDKAVDIFCLLVQQFVAKRPGVFLELGYWGSSRGASISLWTADFEDRQEVDEIVGQIRAAEVMGGFQGSIRYKPEVLVEVLGLDRHHDWQVPTTLYRRDVKQGRGRD